jgi:hypothetical protein
LIDEKLVSKYYNIIPEFSRHSRILGDSILGNKTQFRTEVTNMEAKETCKSFNSASLRAPSLSLSQRTNIRFKAATNLGLKTSVFGSTSGPIG